MTNTPAPQDPHVECVAQGRVGCTDCVVVAFWETKQQRHGDVGCFRVAIEDRSDGKPRVYVWEDGCDNMDEQIH